MHLGDLPVWKGVQDRPGFETLPFVLRVQQGLIRLDTKAVDVRSVVDRYGSPSYTFITTPPGMSEWGTSRGDWYFREFAAVAGDLAGKTVMELGAGTVHVAQRVVNELHARHFIVCDPAIEADQRSTSIEIVPEYFDYSTFRDRKIDLVMSINNLEHIPDPFQYLADVRALLDSTGGKLFVVVPECSRGLRTGDWGICLHEHLSYFTETSFIFTARAAGFKPIWLKTAEDTLLALLESETAEVPDEHDSDSGLLEAAEARFHENVRRMRERLESLKQGNQLRLGMHGCTLGLNNILALLGLHSDPDIHLFDGDSAKVGKFLPAFDKPIRSSQDPSYSSMTDLVIAAATYYDQIRAFAIDRQAFDPERIHTLIPSL